MLKSIVLAYGLLATHALAACTRETLKKATDLYIAAQSSGISDSFADVTQDVKYSENEQPTALSRGVLSQSMKIDSNLSVYDTTACSTFTEIIAASSSDPYVIATRMLFTDDKVTTMESIVTNTGDWAFNATGYLYYESFETWDPIPESKRDTREVIKAVGDSYFERFNDTNVVVPWGPPCNRIEGGAIVAGTLTGEDCTMFWPSALVVTNRRYVIDEEMGTVSIFLGFPGLDRSQGQAPMPDSHLFRVEGGKIRYVHTASFCVSAGCGFSGPPT